MNFENIMMICACVFFCLAGLATLAFVGTFAISEVLDLIDNIKKRYKKEANHD